MLTLEVDKCYENEEGSVMKIQKSGKKYIGVRKRASGRWTSEIKDSSQKLRLWLGTFDKAEEAALAYDCAAMLLRGRYAKTNFPMTQETMNTHHEEKCINVLGKNPRAFQLLKHHAVMKNHAVSSSFYSTMRDEFAMIVEENIVCSIPEKGSEGCYGVSFGSSKVYSSVVVAPSFSSASQFQTGQVHQQTSL